MLTTRGRHWLAVAACLIWTLAPIYWALNTSLETDVRAQSRPPNYLPFPITWVNYAQLLGINESTADLQISAAIRRSALNIFVECTAAMLLTVALAVLAAYAFARMRFRLSNTLFYVVLATMALPAYATLIPLYRVMSAVHLVNTYTGIVLVYTSGILPLAIWILYNYFHGIPLEIEEAAFIDGAGRSRTLWHIVLPIARPGIIATAIITFLSGYSHFLFPLVLTTDISTQPLTVVIASLQGQHRIPYTLLNAGGILTILVPIAVTLILSRYIINGLLAGAVK
jgi:multiple sugar transport system permease protein